MQIKINYVYEEKNNPKSFSYVPIACKIFDIRYACPVISYRIDSFDR